MAKSRFFREQKDETSEERIDDPTIRRYVGPYSRNAHKLATVMESDQIPPDDPDVKLHFYRKEGSLFTATRTDLPSFFVDPRVQVRMTPTMGKGCFALEDIKKNTLIESSPVILVHKDTFSNLNMMNGGVHKISEYPFGWGRDGLCALAMGYGGIYNHRVEMNVAWRPNYDLESIQYTTCRDIEAGEELFIRYLPLSKLGNLWFEDPESEKIAEQHDRARIDESPENMQSWKIFQEVPVKF